MICKVFYSWQSDLPNSTNRNFIEKALETAADAIRGDNTVEVEPVLDRDTRDVPGSPDIVATILDKIDGAAVFVCDVSIINQPSSRLAPNPNVLIELGYAMKTLGPERVILVMNTAFGGPELLPFDLRTRRVTCFNMTLETEDRAAERKELACTLKVALRAALTYLETKVQGEIIQPQSPGESVIAAIENHRTDQASRTDQFMDWLVHQLDSLAPDYTKGEPDDILIQSISQTSQLVVEFARLAKAVAASGASDAAGAIYSGFGAIIGRYCPPQGFRGSWNNYDFDFYKFLGHELFVSFFASLIQEKRWDLVADLLDDSIYVENSSAGRADLAAFSDVSEDVFLLDHRNVRLGLGKASLHADILKQRHTQGEIAHVASFPEFLDADYFLFLRSVLPGAQVDLAKLWQAWSTLCLGSRIPPYLVQAQQTKHASRLLRPLGVESVEDLRMRFHERAPILRNLFGRRTLYFMPLRDFDPRTIGSK